MRVLFVSDVHKTYRPSEASAVEWLLSLIDSLRPDALISAGDWDEGVTEDDFLRIASRTRLVTIYGNHENFAVITKFAVGDGEVIDLSGLKVAGVNGLIGEGRKIYELPPSRFRGIVRGLKRIAGRLDLFVAHQPPYIPEVYPWVEEDEAGKLMLWALQELKPRLFLNGHMSAGCYSYYELPFGTKYLRVDSSQRERCYALLEERRTAVFRDGEEVFSFPF